MKVFLGLGANLNRPQHQMEGALVRLGAPRAVSSLYRTAPVGGPSGQPDYFNAAIALLWDRSPFALLRLIHDIEADFGRERSVRFGPRTLDIDILAISGLSIDSRELQVPHPRARERAFVLVPLADVDAKLAATFGYDGHCPAEVVKTAPFDVSNGTWIADNGASTSTGAMGE